MRIVRYAYPSYRNLNSASGVFGRSPWSGLEPEVNQLFESAFGNIVGNGNRRFPVDLYEDQNNNYVRAELPGVDRADINVEVVDGVLNLTATRKTAAVAATPTTEAQPEQSFSFSRSVNIPTEVQTDQIKAAYENGVLTVTLPKREEAKPRKINVAVN
jgi:HSP20 family protein